jgi:hypothetical protein
MSDYTQFEGASDPRGEYGNLARWLADVLDTSSQVEEQIPARKPGDAKLEQLELQLGSNYHLRFYQQLPDFIMALLSQEPDATIRYAPLLYHLAGCHDCHQAYLELYDALDAAVHPQGERPLLGQGTQTLRATPPRMLAHLCKTLISQAESLLLQARHDHVDNDEAARSLLQLAVKMSASISQSAVRRQGLQDLVRVATLFDGPTTPRQDDPDVHAYTPVLVTAGGVRGKRSVRGGNVLERSNTLDQPEIIIQSHNLEGRIVQHGKMLELQLRDLAPELRGRFVAISVILGSLLEPVRWNGGNPRAIRSIAPVDANGSLVTPLGETDMLLSDPEDHNLLETLFLLLEVRAIS